MSHRAGAAEAAGPSAAGEVGAELMLLAERLSQPIRRPGWTTNNAVAPSSTTARTPPMTPIGDGSSTRDLAMPRGSFSDRPAYCKNCDRAGADHVFNYIDSDADAHIRNVASDGVDVIVELAAGANAELDQALLPHARDDLRSIFVVRNRRGWLSF